MIFHVLAVLSMRFECQLTASYTMSIAQVLILIFVPVIAREVVHCVVEEFPGLPQFTTAHSNVVNSCHTFIRSFCVSVNN